VRLPVAPSTLLVDVARRGMAEGTIEVSDPGVMDIGPTVGVLPGSSGSGTGSFDALHRQRDARRSMQASAYPGGVLPVPASLEPRSRAAVILLTADPTEEQQVREAV